MITTRSALFERHSREALSVTPSACGLSRSARGETGNAGGGGVEPDTRAARRPRAARKRERYLTSVAWRGIFGALLKKSLEECGTLHMHSGIHERLGNAG